MKFLFLESFYAGSHARFADGLKAASSHAIDLATLPGENWRWRMLGSALHFARQMPPLSDYDGLIVSDLFNLADFLAAAGPRRPPVLAYFHENQITYPQPGEDKSTLQLGMINISTALAADTVAFNSAFHMNTFLSAADAFLAGRPDCRLEAIKETLEQKSIVLHPGIDLHAPTGAFEKHPAEPPLIIWNHRWSYDKGYPLFLETIEALAGRGLDFRVAILGENFGRVPPEFTAARERLTDRVVQFGFVENRRTYQGWLQRGDIVVSTATQENFGLSVAEAVAHGCLPLAPHALSYPEILPSSAWDTCLYKGKKALVEKLAGLISDHAGLTGLRRELAGAMARFSWARRIGDFDHTLRALASRKTT
ncbi:MAG: tRNA-queuosine alpha-mannosyltransferase domain-containing protein [Thermodesulfobacteriota bacterium]